MQTFQGGAPDLGPISVGVKKNNVLYTAVIPVRPDGSFETGSMTEQAELTLSNLKAVVEEAGGTLQDVVQVIVYLTDIQETAEMTAVWKKYFSAPFPNRATIGIQALTVPNMRIEMVATAVIS